MTRAEKERIFNDITPDPVLEGEMSRIRYEVKTKICYICGIRKPFDEFHKHNGGYKGGVRCDCKECRRRPVQKLEPSYLNNRVSQDVGKPEREVTDLEREIKRQAITTSRMLRESRRLNEET